MATCYEPPYAYPTGPSAALLPTELFTGQHLSGTGNSSGRFSFSAPNASDLIIFAWDHSPFYICPLNSGLGIISSLKVLDVPRKSLNLLLRPHNELRSFSMQVLKSPPCPAHKVTSFSPTDPLPGCFRETCNLNDATWQSCFPSDSEPPALISFYSYDTLSQARWLRTTDTHHCLTPSNF